MYTFATPKLQPMITSESGKALIQTCLNTPDPAADETERKNRMVSTGYEETELTYPAEIDDDGKEVCAVKFTSRPAANHSHVQCQFVAASEFDTPLALSFALFSFS